MGGDQGCEFVERLVEVLGELIDQADLQGLLGTQVLVAGGVLEDHPHRGLGADHRLQQGGALPTGQDAQAGLGQAQAPHRGGGGADIGHQRHLEPAAEGDAVEVGEHRDRAGANTGSAGTWAARVSFPRRSMPQWIGEHRQVGAGEENTPGAGHRDRLNLSGLGAVQSNSDPRR